MRNMEENGLKKYFSKRFFKEKTYLLWIGLFVSAFMLFYRRPDALTHPQFWCEDGQLFFAQSYHMGFVSFFHPYAGYLHAFPRIVSISAEYLLDTSTIPAYYNFVSFGTFLLLVVYVWYRSNEDKYVLLGMILCLTMLPIGNEIYLTITDQQWSLALALLLPLAYKKSQKKWIFIDTGVILLVGLSGPFVVFFLPIVLFRYWKSQEEWRKDSIKSMPFLAYAFTSALQIVSLSFFSVERSEGNPSFGEVVGLSLKLYYQQFVHLVHHPEWTDTHSKVTIFIVGTLLVLLTFYLWYLSVRRVIREGTNAAFVFITASLFLFVATLYGFRRNLGSVHPVAFAAYGPRYFFIPLVTFFWGVFTLFKASGRFKYFVVIAFATLLLLRSHVYTPTRFAEMHWQDYVSKFDQKTPFLIPINPPGRDWYIEVDPKDHRNYKKYLDKIGD